MMDSKVMQTAPQPAHTLRPGVPPVPRRMQALRVSEKGYPVPWFVEWIDGKPDFRVMDGIKLRQAVKHGNCWLCGEVTGRHKTFVIGPMCVVNRTTAEPPSHHDCATFAAMACPFLILPKAKRREANLPEHVAPAGFSIPRNPGATCLYTTQTFKPYNAHTLTGGGRGVLMELGEPTSLEWYAEGKRASRAAVLESIDSGMHLLWAAAHKDRDITQSLVDLENAYARAMTLLPAA